MKNFVELTFAEKPKKREIAKVSGRKSFWPESTNFLHSDNSLVRHLYSPTFRNRREFFKFYSNYIVLSHDAPPIKALSLHPLPITPLLITHPSHSTSFHYAPSLQPLPISPPSHYALFPVRPLPITPSSHTGT